MRDGAGPEPAGFRVGDAAGLTGIFVLTLVLHLLVAGSGPHLATLTLADTDSYTRMLRVLQLWHGDGWYETVLPQLNAPDGLPMHWTRPLDLGILAIALGPLLRDMDPALPLHAAGVLICPVLHGIACMVAVWAARGLWPRRWAWLAGILLLLSPLAFGYSVFGRADHHTLIMLAGVTGLGFSLRAARGHQRAAWWAGIAFGLGVWVLPEVLLIAMPVLAAFGLLWLLGEREAAPQGMRIALGMALAVALALPVERAPATLLVAQPDRISIHHLALAIVVAAVFAAVRRLPPLALPGRAIAGGAVAACGLGALLLAWPNLLDGAVGAADDEHGADFVRKVVEMQPLRFDSLDAWRDALMVAGGAIPAAIALLLGLRAMPAVLGPQRLAPTLITAAALAVTLAATISARRFSVDLAVPASIAAAGLVPLAMALATPYGPAMRIPAVVITVTLAFFLPMLVSRPIEFGRPGCDPVAMALWLAEAHPPLRGPAAWEGRVLLADDVNAGPAIAYFTGLRLVAAPYHQVGAAIHDNDIAFGPDEAAARAAMERRRVSLVMVCTRVEPTEGAPDLRGRLAVGDAPAWLRPVPIPEEAETGFYRLYEFVPAAPGATR